jgi:hypothetical protein
MLNEKQISAIGTMIDWSKGDGLDIEEMLSEAGKGESGDYEHFFLTMGIHHLEEFISNMSEIVKRHDFREGSETSLAIVNGSNIVEVPIISETDQRAINEYEKITKLCEEVIAEFPDTVAAHRAGEIGPLGYLTGQVVKRFPKATTATVAELIGAYLAE